MTKLALRKCFMAFITFFSFLGTTLASSQPSKVSLVSHQADVDPVLANMVVANVFYLMQNALVDVSRKMLKKSIEMQRSGLALLNQTMQAYVAEAYILGANEVAKVLRNQTAETTTETPLDQKSAAPKTIAEIQIAARKILESVMELSAKIQKDEAALSALRYHDCLADMKSELKKDKALADAVRGIFKDEASVFGFKSSMTKILQNEPTLTKNVSEKERNQYLEDTMLILSEALEE